MNARSVKAQAEARPWTTAIPPGSTAQTAREPRDGRRRRQVKALWAELSFLWKALILIDALLIAGKAGVWLLAINGMLP